MVHASTKKNQFEVVYCCPIGNPMTCALKTSTGKYGAHQVVQELDQMLQQVHEEILKAKTKPVQDTDKHHQDGTLRKKIGFI